MSVRLPILLITIFAAISGLIPSVHGQTDECSLFAKQLLAQTDQNDRNSLINNYVQITSNASCFVEANLAMRTEEEKREAKVAFQPAIRSFFDALQQFSGGQQQGSSLSSSGTTNAVTKPAGLTGFAEEFGGVNVTSGTSTLTATWSPGTAFVNLAESGKAFLCLAPNYPNHCISEKVLKAITPLTLKITANTSSSSPSMSGSAASAANPGASSQQVTVSSKGASGPSLAGATVQYSFLASKPKAAVSALVQESQSPSSPSLSGSVLSSFLAEVVDANQLSNELQKCGVYKTWKDGKPSIPAAGESLRGSAAVVDRESEPDKAETLAKVIESGYQALFKDMQTSPECQPAIHALSNLMGSVLIAEAYEEFDNNLSSNSAVTPELSIEYDLNTPTNKPAYSSVKLSGSWQFGRSLPGSDNPGSSQQIAALNTAVRQTRTAVSQPGGDTRQLAGAVKPLAQATTPPWSFTFNADIDIYDPKPPSTIPDAHYIRDIQAGAEIAYLFSPTPDSSPLRTLIGSVRASAAYSYQDQISPAIFTGPALNDFTGLPSSTTAAYVQRGIIHLAQAKLGFGTGSTFSYPLSFTYSNRTEFVTHPTWGVQFGVTWDLNSLFASSKPSS